MTISSPPNDLESRYAFLLQPIRDLTKNWDVDIANHLEEYLEEIESITITFDGGSTTMNFAQAALMIQGTTCVYSRKVEYLYSLVYQVLDLLASKKKNKQSSSVDPEGNDADADFPDDADEEFLKLDDIKEHKNIDMKHDGDDQTQSVQCVPRTPMALIPLDDGEKGSNPLLSKTGELLGSRNDFKMNTCNIHQTGTLLLDMSHLSLMECSIQAKTSTPLPDVQRNDKPLEFGPVEIDMNQNSCNEAFPPDVSMDDNNVEMQFDNVDEPGDNKDDKQVDSETLTVGLRRSERRKELVADRRKILPQINHWEIHDPHCCDKMVEKPFKKGRTTKIPASLQTSKKKRKKTPEKKALVPISQYVTSTLFSHSSKYPKTPLKVPTYSELEQMYWLEYKRRRNFRRKEMATLAAEGRYEELAEVEEEDEPNDLPAPGDDDFDDCDGGGFPCGDLAIGADVLSTRDNNKISLSLGSQSSQALIITSYEELVRNHVEGFLESAQQYAHFTELSKRVAEWEDNIRPRLEEEETHPHFDIHEYGTQVIDHFSILQGGKKVPFRHIAAGKKPYEVCRLFLATLQLANNYNIKIDCEGKLEKGVDKMTVELLSTKRIYEELAEYQAPSKS